MIYKLAITLLSISLLSACASIFTGTSQDISVNTPGCPSAQCTLANNEGSWSIDKTPGTVAVTKDSTTLVIECKTNDSVPVVTTINADYEGIVWGNILLGGLIGLFIDMGTGAINKYSKDHIDIDLTCNTNI